MNLTATIPELTDIWSRAEPNLPALLSCGQELKKNDEKALFYLSTFTAISGLLTRVSGVYHQREVFPNLFLIASAPPASGKGVLMAPRVLLAKIHTELLRESTVQQRAYKKSIAGRKNGELSLTRPPFRIAFIPANCTSAKLIQHMTDNGSTSPSIILESEIDTLSNANGSEHGSFSDLLRKAFHNEPISYTRKFNDEFLEIEDPKLAISLSGTPEQIFKLIGSASDGLFSRFMFYNFNGSSDWEDVSPQSGKKDFTNLLVEQQQKYYEFWSFFKDRSVKITLSDDQWQALNKYFNDEMELLRGESEVYSPGVLKRHGVMLFKLCMVLTALRAFDAHNGQDTLRCDDKDFEIARNIVDISLSCSMDLLTNMPKPSTHIRLGNNVGLLLPSLPAVFTRQEAIEKGKILKVSVRTVDRCLKTLAVKGLISHQAHGIYEKVTMSEN